MYNLLLCTLYNFSQFFLRFVYIAYVHIQFVLFYIVHIIHYTRTSIHYRVVLREIAALGEGEWPGPVVTEGRAVKLDEKIGR